MYCSSTVNENHLQNPVRQYIQKSGIIKEQNTDDCLDEFKESDHPVIRMGSFQRAAPVDNHSQKANKKKAPSMLLVYRRHLKNLYEG